MEDMAYITKIEVITGESGSYQSPKDLGIFVTLALIRGGTSIRVRWTDPEIPKHSKNTKYEVRIIEHGI